MRTAGADVICAHVDAQGAGRIAQGIERRSVTLGIGCRAGLAGTGRRHDATRHAHIFPALADFVRKRAEGINAEIVGEVIAGIHDSLGDLSLRRSHDRIDVGIVLHRLQNGQRHAAYQTIGIRGQELAGGLIGDAPVQPAHKGEVREGFFDRHIEEAAVEQRHAYIGGDVVIVATIAFQAAVIASGGGGQCAARGLLLQNEVHDAGDGVGAVLGGSAVQQHFDVIDRRFRKQRDVGARTAGGEVAAIDVQVAGIMTALAVHQHQSVIRRKAAQRGGERQRGGIETDLLRGEGGNGLAQRLAQIGRAGALGQGVVAQHGDGRGASRRPSCPARACRSRSRFPGRCRCCSAPSRARSPRQTRQRSCQATANSSDSISSCDPPHVVLARVTQRTKRCVNPIASVTIGNSNQRKTSPSPCYCCRHGALSQHPLEVMMRTITSSDVHA